MNLGRVKSFLVFQPSSDITCMTVLTLQLQDIASSGSQLGRGVTLLNPKIRSKTRSSSPQVVSGWVGGALINPAFSKLGREC